LQQWRESSSRPDDPPLSSLGLKQAAEMGAFLDSFLFNEGVHAENIYWMSSPFLRCLQTSHAAIDAFKSVDGDLDEIKILIEDSIFEWDGHNGIFHRSLPTNVEERRHYFPRLDAQYKSMFVPKLPEPRDQFHGRCQQVGTAVHKRYPYRPKTAIIAVTHAAGCIGLAAALTNLTIADITPAAPCSIYKLTRTSSTSTWTIDAHDIENSMNGYTDHISEMGQSTVPWNNFADKKYFHGYTGPATSRFAPAGYIPVERKDEL
jgi:broad specificity phosphatase PhoE